MLFCIVYKQEKEMVNLQFNLLLASQKCCSSQNPTSKSCHTHPISTTSASVSVAAKHPILYSANTSHSLMVPSLAALAHDMLSMGVTS
jgi:hypothetical protein